MGEDKFFSAEGSAKKDPQTNSPEAEKTASSSAQKSPNETLRSTQNSVADQNAANAVQQEKAKDSHSLEIDPASAEKQDVYKRQLYFLMIRSHHLFLEQFSLGQEQKPFAYTSFHLVLGAFASFISSLSIDATTSKASYGYCNKFLHKNELLKV